MPVSRSVGEPLCSPCGSTPGLAWPGCVIACMQVIQLFDSWAHHLTPEQFAVFSLPYAERVVAGLKARHPDVPVILHANGGTGACGRCAERARCVHAAPATATDQWHQQNRGGHTAMVAFRTWMQAVHACLLASNTYAAPEPCCCATTGVSPAGCL